MSMISENYENSMPTGAGFERSQCVVRTSHDGVLLRAGGTAFCANWVENLDVFKSQLHDGTFLCLERREMERWRILEIIQPGSILHEVHSIAFSMGLDFSFDEEVEREVADCLCRPLDMSGCIDRRNVPFVTVDGAGTRDLDQALFVARPDEQDIIHPLPDTYLVACYAIADASFFVPPDSALFRSALRRGSSMYFAGMSVPMLPHAFSRGIVSLNANADRRALLFIMQIDASGKCLHTDLERAVIHSRARLSNQEVERFLDDPEHHRFAQLPFANSLLRFRDFGEIRKLESASRNVVSFNRVALCTTLNPQKTAFDLGLDERSRVDLYNEQFSLLCNMEGARLLNSLVQTNPGVLAIFRNHEAPSDNAIDAVEIQINAIVRAQHLNGVWIWDRHTQSLAAYLNGLPDESTHDGHLFRIRQAIERAILMMQRRSTFSPEAGLHSALGVNPYARFSAPMRELVGIFTHKEAVDALFSPDGHHKHSLNDELRARVIDSANHARAVQRDLDKAIDSCAIAHAIASDFDLPEHKRPVRNGTILGMKPSALYVRLDMPPIELKIYTADMQLASHEMWTINEDLTVCTNKSGSIRYAIGDCVGIRVLNFEEQKKKWRVILVPPVPCT